MWVNKLFYLGLLEQLLCTCLPYGFVRFWPVAVLNILFGRKFEAEWKCRQATGLLARAGHLLRL
jgi:hypothetical protein